MSSANPPYPYYNGIPYNKAFFDSSTGLSRSQANALYLNKTIPDKASVLETFNGGILVNTIAPLTTAGNISIGVDTSSTGTITIGDATQTSTTLSLASRTVNLGATTGTTNVYTPLTIGYTPSTITGTSQFGYLKTVTGTVSVTTGATPYDICNTGSLPAGIWLVTATFAFPSIPVNQIYYAWLNTISTQYATGKSIITLVSLGTGPNALSTTYIFQTTSAQTFYATAQFNTSTGSVTGQIQAVRIG